MDNVVEGLRVKALTQLPPFLLALIRPLKSASTGLSTNLAVLQTTLLLKYQPFYTFLYRQSPRLAKQVERGYINAARAYYETGMRRYARALGQIKSRTVEKSDLIGVVSSEAAQAVLSNTPTGVKQAYERLRYSELDVEGEGGVVLAYMADDKDYVRAMTGTADGSALPSKRSSARSAWCSSTMRLQSLPSLSDSSRERYPETRLGHAKAHPLRRAMLCQKQGGAGQTATRVMG